MSAVLNDLKYAVRGLLRTPGFTIVALLTLALGIGANSAIFSVVNGVVLKPLGYPEPERLMFITSQFPGLGFDKFWVSPPEYFEFRERNRAFQEVGAYSVQAANLGDAGTEPMRVPTALVTAPLMKVLGVAPQVGRALTDADNLPNAPDVGLLSHELWQRAFNGDPKVIGRAIDINGTRTTIVGIMPPRFDVHDEGVELWLPITLDPNERVQRRGSHFLYLVGRLKPGVSSAQANSDLQAVLQRYEEENGARGQGNGIHAPNRTNHRLQMETLQSEVVGTARKALLVLQGAVVFVLLIACANMANLLLARSESRHKEFAIRTALGADRMRLLRQFVTEGVLLSVVGGALGLALAFVGVRALLKANEDSIPRATEVGLDPMVLAVTLIVAVGTGVIFGLAPMLHLGQRGVSAALREGGRRSTATAGRLRLRRGLVIAEVGLAVVLVIGAGLMLRSFWNLMNVDAGFDRRNLSTFGLVLPAATYPDANRRVQLFSEVTTRLSQLPGVEAAAAMTGLPPRRQVNANDTQIEGNDGGPGKPPNNIDYYQYVTRDYLKTMGIPLLEGRSFSVTDDGKSAPVLMVNETTAKLYWPNESAIGKRIKPGFGPFNTLPWYTVVGVVKDVKQGGIDSKTGTEIYISYEQIAGLQNFAPGNMNIVIRSSRDPASLAAPIRQIVTSVDRMLPIVQLRTMDEVFSRSAARPRFLMQLLGVFALLALALAAVGTYGVLSYTVSEREREIGIRMALGADRGTVVGMVLRQGLWMVVGGLVIGVGGAIALRTVVASMLFNVKPEDPATYAAVAVFITLVAVVASFIPARRATKVDPMVALRTD